MSVDVSDNEEFPWVRFRFFSAPGGNYWSVQLPTDQKSTENR